MHLHVPRRRRIAAQAQIEVLARRYQQEQRYYYEFEGHPYYDCPVDPQFGGFLSFLGRLLRRLVSLCIVLTLSVATYHVFYYCIMPRIVLQRDLYFRYNQTQAWAEIDLELAQDWIASESILPIHTTSSLSSSYQDYFVQVDLHLPESLANRQAGMFGVVTTLSTHNTTLGISHRSARFPYETEWVRQVRKIASLFPLLVRAYHEIRVVSVSVLRHYRNDEESLVRIL